LIAVRSVRKPPAFAAIALRTALGVFGGAAIVWALYAGPVFWRASPFESTAKYIVAGDTFKPAVLDAIDTRLTSADSSVGDRPATLYSAAVIRLRLLERAIADGEQEAIDAQMAHFTQAVRQSLSDNPSDPLLWSVLFWAENTRSGFKRGHLEFLRMSYATGPNEGWIGVRRNRLALAVYPQLPPDIAEAAVDEFARLIDSQFIAPAANILVGPGWPIRETLLARLKSVELANRQRFARTVYRLGYDISVPGVEPRGQRPWD
jgi:hypothetical protein